MAANRWRRIREQLRALVLLAVVSLAGLLVGGYILANQRVTWPSWTPIVGEHWFTLSADFADAAGVMPGQGQAVTVSGVRVGEITRVTLHDGRARVRMRLRERYGRVYSDATMLLRPKTGLKDMIVQLDPGGADGGRRLRSGAVLSVAATEPDVDLDEILAMLDGDTRASLVQLLTDGSRALGDGGGARLAQVFRRFEPLSRHAAEATRLVAQRRARLKRLMGNLSLLATELGDHDEELTRFVSANAAAFGRFANQREALGETLDALPGTLATVRAQVPSIGRLGRRLQTASDALAPTTRDLAGAFRGVRPFLRETTPVLRDDLRPFARAAQPTARELVPATRDLAAALPGLSRFTGTLNALFNGLAYDPPGTGVGNEPYLFYVPWANHNTNSVLSSQDGVTASRRSLVMLSCGSLQLLKTLPRRNPTLNTLTKLLAVPDYDELVAGGKCAGPPGGTQDEVPAP